MRSAASPLLLCLITNLLGVCIGNNGRNGSSTPILNSSVSLNYTNTVPAGPGDILQLTSSNSSYGKSGNISLFFNVDSAFSNGDSTELFYDSSGYISTPFYNASDFVRGSRRRRSTLKEDLAALEKQLEELRPEADAAKAAADAAKEAHLAAVTRMNESVADAAKKRVAYATANETFANATAAYDHAVIDEATKNNTSKEAQREFDNALGQWQSFENTRKQKEQDRNAKNATYQTTLKPCNDAFKASDTKNKTREASRKIRDDMEKWKTGNSTEKTKADEESKKIFKRIEKYDLAIATARRWRTISENPVLNKTYKTNNSVTYGYVEAAIDKRKYWIKKSPTDKDREGNERVLKWLEEIKELNMGKKTIRQLRKEFETLNQTAYDDAEKAYTAVEEAEKEAKNIKAVIYEAPKGFNGDKLKFLKDARDFLTKRKSEFETKKKKAEDNIKQLDKDIPIAKTKYEDDSAKAGSVIAPLIAADNKRAEALGKLEAEQKLLDKEATTAANKYNELVKPQEIAKDATAAAYEAAMKNKPITETARDNAKRDTEGPIKTDSLAADALEAACIREEAEAKEKSDAANSKAYTVGNKIKDILPKIAELKLELDKAGKAERERVIATKAREARAAEEKKATLGKVGIGLGVVFFLAIIAGAVGGTILIMKKRAAKNQKPKRKKKEYETKDGEVRVDILDEDNDKIDKAIIKGKTFDKVGAFDRKRRGYLKDNNTPGIDGIIPYFIGKEKNEAFKCKAYGEDFVDNTETVKDKNAKSVEGCDLTDKRNYDRTGDSMKFTEEEEEEERKKKLAAANKEPLAEITAKSSKKSKRPVEKKDVKKISSSNSSQPSSNDSAGAGDVIPDSPNLPEKAKESKEAPKSS